MMSNQACQMALDQAQVGYNVGVTVPVALTVLVSVLAGHCLKRRLEDSRFRRSYYGSMGCIKILLAALLGLVLVPTCPSGCYCQGDMSNYMFYPMIAFLIGVRWLAAAVAPDPRVVHATAVPMDEEEEEDPRRIVATKGDFKVIPMVEAELSPV